MSGGLVSTLNMSAGTYVEIKVPVDTGAGQGQFPLAKDRTVTVNGVQDRTHIYGFVVENETVGTIEDIPGDDVAIKYSHLKNETNRIFYYTANMEKYIIAIISMPLHDHSSIPQGGPAFGTYYYDKKQEET